MNTSEQLEQQSHAAVIAYLQDSSVRLEKTHKYELVWSINCSETFYMCLLYYRIAQPKPWYRVALFDDDVYTARNEKQENNMASCAGFIKWLTERIEYSNEDNKSIKD